MKWFSLFLFTVAFGSIVSVSRSVWSSAFDVRVLSDGPYGTLIEFKLDDYYIREVAVDGKQCSKVILPGAITFLKKGYPELPQVSKSIIIPDADEMGYKIIESEYETRAVYPVIPSKGNLPRSVHPASVPWTFSEFYSADAWFPTEVVELHEPFILRDFRGITIQFNPFQYNPVRGELKICKRIIVEVYPRERSQMKSAPTEKLNVKTRRSSAISREFCDIYRNIFINFPAVSRSVWTSAKFDTVYEVGRMLIITKDAYYNNVLPLRDWKLKKGIPTKLVKYSDVGSGASAVKAYIQNEYNTDGVTFVLLVGDAEDIPPAIGTVGAAFGAPADPCYTYLEGADYFPDAFISRFSANTAGQVDNQVARSIKYERNPMDGAEWYHWGTGIASDDDGGTGITDWERCDWLRDSLLYYLAYDAIDRIYDPGATAGQVKDSLEKGRSIVNYIGHGGETFWVTTGFSNSDVASLLNTDMLPSIISVACVNGQFVGITCFGEAWLRAGNASTPRGAIAFYGSSISQSWVPPCVGQMEAVRLLCHNKMNTIGGYMFNGACGMIEEYLPGNEGVEMFQTWHIFGDCSIQLRTDTPIPINVSHPAVIPVGPYNLSINVSTAKVPVEDALVCALVDTVPVSGYTDAGGNVTLPVTTTVPDTVWITVTGYNLIPYEGYCLSIASGVYVTYLRHEINDSLGNNDGIVDAGETIELPIWVKNWGSDTANGVEGILSTSDTFVTITTNFATFGNIPPGDSAQNSTPYVVDVSQFTPDSHWVTFDLTCKDALDSTWVSKFSIPIKHYIGVTLTSPNGGEEWLGLSVHPVTWDIVGIGFDSYRLLYSLAPDSLLDTVSCSISSPHPYPNNYDNTWVIWDSGAQKITIHFDSLQTEAGYDFVYLYDKYDNQIAKYDGNLGAFWAKPVPGDTVKIRLYSDGWINGYGFDIDKYAVVHPGEGYKDTIAKNISPDSSSWNWTLPNVTCTTARVKVEIIDPLGEVIVADESDDYFTIIKVGTEEERLLPITYKLSQVYPNPVDKKVVIKYQLPVEAEVSLRIYDVCGRLVKTLVDEKKKPGYYKVEWDRTDNRGNQLPCGIYFYRMKTDNFTATKKLIVMQ